MENGADIEPRVLKNSRHVTERIWTSWAGSVKPAQDWFVPPCRIASIQRTHGFMTRLLPNDCLRGCASQLAETALRGGETCIRRNYPTFRPAAAKKNDGDRLAIPKLAEMISHLWADNDLQGLRGLKALTEDTIAGGDLGDGVDVNDVIAMSHHIPERNGHIGGARLEFEMLVPDGRGALVCNCDCDNDDGEIEGFF